jgi:hypothetical protein
VCISRICTVFVSVVWFVAVLPSVSVCISACQSYLCLICISRISVLVYQCVSVLGMCGSVSQCVSVLAQESLFEMADAWQQACDMTLDQMLRDLGVTLA